MKNIFLFSLLYFFLILFVTGCSRERTITGEIFVVTEGGQNYKLGLVSVGLVSAEKLTPHIEKKTKEANDNLLPIYSNYRQLKDSIALLDKLDNDLEQKRRLLRIYDENNELLSVLNKLRSVIQRKISLDQTIAPLEDTFERYTSGGFFLHGLPQLDDSSKTDSEGRFNLLGQKDRKYFIVASASRSPGDKTEYYYWIVEYPNPSFREGEKILLSNDNLFEPLIKLSLTGR
jgi:hypothetical protein